VNVDEALAAVGQLDDGEAVDVLADEVRRLRLAVKQAWMEGLAFGFKHEQWNTAPGGYQRFAERWERDVRSLLCDDYPLSDSLAARQQSDIDPDTGEPYGGFTV
jgi:hypothetical protein